MNLSELQSLLKRYSLAPSRKLGQSFLVDAAMAQWIVDQLQIGPDDCVIEVGSGFGALTEHLVGRCRRLVLIEADGRIAKYLEEKYGPLGVEVVHADATVYDVRPLFLEGVVKFIGNLPYSVGNTILQRFLDAPSPVTQALIMVQKEVADRFVAEPRSKDYGILTLMLRERWHITSLRTIGPELFHPRPAVDSTIVRFDRRPPGELAAYSPEVYREIVKRGFSQRRKQLQNNLQLESDKTAEIFGAMGLKTSARAEELSLEQWIALSNRLDPHPCSLLPPAATESLDAVDENDLVVATLPRREIHAGKHLHRAVHVFVRNKLGEIFLQFRSHLKDTHGLKWDSSASGHVDPGESYADCAVREMWEEIWVRPKGELVRIARIEASEATDLEFIEVFLGEAQGRIRTHGKEVDSGRWFSPEFVEKWIAERPQDFATGFITCFMAWRETLSLTE